MDATVAPVIGFTGSTTIGRNAGLHNILKSRRNVSEVIVNRGYSPVTTDQA